MVVGEGAAEKEFGARWKRRYKGDKKQGTEPLSVRAEEESITLGS